MVRRLLRFLLAGLLLLLAIAAAILWVRSYWTVDVIGGTTTRREWSITSSGGRMTWHDSTWPNRIVRLPFGHWSSPRSERPPWWEQNPTAPGRRHWMGFEWSESVYPIYSGWASPFAKPQRLVALPHWTMVALMAIEPLRYGRKAFRHHHRRRRGLCIVCGYDLRATPDRCPECGTPVHQPHALP